MPTVTTTHTAKVRTRRVVIIIIYMFTVRELRYVFIFFFKNGSADNTVLYYKL